MVDGTHARRVVPSAAIRFEAQVRAIGDRTILMLPDHASAKLPSRGQVAVTALVAGLELKTVLEPDGRRGHWLALDEQTRQALGAKDGDTLELELEPAKVWPEPAIPDDFQAALDGAPDLSELWSEITPMARWEWVRWINATRKTDTRRRRIEVGISKLRSGKRRPCCFDLAACTDPDLSKNGKLVEAV